MKEPQRGVRILLFSPMFPFCLTVWKSPIRHIKHGLEMNNMVINRKENNPSPKCIIKAIEEGTMRLICIRVESLLIPMREKCMEMQ